MAALHCTNTKTEYMRRLEVFHTKTGQDEHLDKLLSEILPPAVATIELDLKKRTQFNILSIGCGDGRTDLAILKIINGCIERLKDFQGVFGEIELFNRGIDPNDIFLDIYKKMLENLPEELRHRHINFEIYPPRTFRDYAVQPKGDVKFDVVQIIQSLYFIDDIEEMLVHCYNTELREKGLIVICSAGPKNLMCVIEKYDKSLGLLALELLNQSLHAVLEKYSWQFEEYTEEHDFDVSDVFDETSEEGNALLDFLRFKIDFRSNSSSEDVQKFLDSIKKNSVHKDGKYFAHFEQKIIIIHK